MGDIPNNQDMRIIREMIPGIKKQGAEHAIGRAIKRVKKMGKLCAICGESIKIETKERAPYCPDCQAKLDRGWTALVDMGMRFMWIDFKGDVKQQKELFLQVVGKMPPGGFLEEFTVRGCVLPTLSGAMDFLLNKNKQIEDSNAKN